MSLFFFGRLPPVVSPRYALYLCALTFAKAMVSGRTKDAAAIAGAGLGSTLLIVFIMGANNIRTRLQYQSPDWC